MDSYRFERCFIATACEIGAKKFGSLMAYAKEIWPEKDEKTASQTLYAIQKKSSKTGRPQKLRLEEAVIMVNLLGQGDDFASFCWRIEQKLKAGWTEQTAQPHSRPLPPSRATRQEAGIGASSLEAVSGDTGEI